MKFPDIKTEKDFDSYFESKIWLDVAREICERHQISFNQLKRADSSDHIVFFVDDALILKIYRPFRKCFERETKALEFIDGKIDFKTPEIVKIGAVENLNYVFLTQLPGAAMTRNDWLKVPEKQQIEFISKLAVGLKQIHELNADFFECNWAEFVKDRAETFVERQIAHGVNSEIIKALPSFIEENLKLVPVNSPTVFMHSDVHFGNLRVIKFKWKPRNCGTFRFRRFATRFLRIRFSRGRCFNNSRSSKTSARVFQILRLFGK